MWIKNWWAAFKLKWDVYLCKQLCKQFGHNEEYKGWASRPATFWGEPWPYKCNYKVYQCKRCGWTNKTNKPVRVETEWMKGKKHKRSML